MRFIGSKFGATDFLLAIALFFYTLVGSIVVGLIVGLASALLFRLISFKESAATEVVILIIFAFSAYLIAEAFRLSGIMSLFFCGVVMGHYTWYNLSEYTKLTTPQTFKTLSLFAEMYIFLYLGLALFSFTGLHAWKWQFILISLVCGLIIASFVVILVAVVFFFFFVLLLFLSSS